MSSDLDVLDLEVGDRGRADGAPVDHAVGAVEVAAPVQLDEHLDHRAGVLVVHREALVLVVERAAELLELVDDRRAGFLAPVPDAPHELLAPELLAREVDAPEHALDDVLRCDPGVVGAEIQSALRPCMRRRRTITSCIEPLSAWPMCSEPVTLGGGTAITNGSPGSSGSTANAPRLRPAREHRRLDRGGVVARLGLETLAGGVVHLPGILGPDPRPRGDRPGGH